MHFIIAPDGRWIPLQGTRVVHLPEIHEGTDHETVRFILEERRSRHIPVVSFEENKHGPFFYTTPTRETETETAPHHKPLA